MTRPHRHDREKQPTRSGEVWIRTSATTVVLMGRGSTPVGYVIMSAAPPLLREAWMAVRIRSIDRAGAARYHAAKPEDRRGFMSTLVVEQQCPSMRSAMRALEAWREADMHRARALYRSPLGAGLAMSLIGAAAMFRSLYQ